MRNLKRKIMIISLMLLSSLVILSCTNGDGTNTTNNPNTEDNINHTFDLNTVYYRGDGYEVTYRDLYDSIKINDGIDQLTNLVDHMLLADYFSLITVEQINAKRIHLIYNTNDQEVIDKITAENKVKMEKSYENGMYVLGYGNDDLPYLRLMVARDLYAKDILTNPEIENNNFLLNAKSVADYYVKNKIGQVHSILIKFDSRSEITNLFLENNLVEYNQELRLYTDTEKDLKDVPSNNITEENTRPLANDELLAFFLQFYNEIYEGQKEELPTGSSLQDLIDKDDLSYEFADLQKISTRLGNLMFTGLTVLNTTNPTNYYTYKAYEVKVSNVSNFYLVLNLDRDYHDLTDFDGDKAELMTIIGETVYDEIYDLLIEENLNNKVFVDGRVKELRNKNNFEILDYYLRLDYESIVPEDLKSNNLNKSDYVVARINGEDILVKDFMDHALITKAPLYLLHSVQLKVLLDEHFNNVYCDDKGNCELDYTKNNSAAMNGHLTEFTTMKNGYSKTDPARFYTFDDFLYLAYGVRNDVEMMQNYYIKHTLEPLFIYDFLDKNKTEVIGNMMDLLDGYYNNYFSLNAKHVLIYLDQNGDGKPDDYEDFYDELTDKAGYDALITGLQVKIHTYLDENEDDLTKLINAYNSASRSDSVWGEYKRFGIKLLTEDLSAKTSLNYMNSYLAYEDAFVDGLVDLYQKYTLPAHVDKDFVYNDSLIETTYGLHLIKASKGSDFEMPSAKFEITPETSDDFSALLNNSGDRLTAGQIEVFLNYRIFDQVAKVIPLEKIYDFTKPAIPERLKEVLSFFIQDIYDSYYSMAYLNIGMIETLLEGSLVDDSKYSHFTTNEINDFLNGLVDVYQYQLDSQFQK